LDLLRRDEIWFADKDSSGATILYPPHKFQPLVGCLDANSSISPPTCPRPGLSDGGGRVGVAPASKPKRSPIEVQTRRNNMARKEPTGKERMLRPPQAIQASGPHASSSTLRKHIRESNSPRLARSGNRVKLNMTECTRAPRYGSRRLMFLRLGIAVRPHTSDLFWNLQEKGESQVGSHYEFSRGMP
jgi:hypothetical protein